MNPKIILRSIAFFICFSLSVPLLSAKAHAQENSEGVEAKILGDWVLENAKGTVIADMQITRKDNGNYDLVRLGGGALAVSGEYKLEGTKLVKVRRANDAYADLTWQYASGRLKLKKGDYKDWVLTKKAPKPKPGT